MGDLGATYDDHLRLVAKRVGDFLLVLTELFSLGRTAEALRAIICSKSAISLRRGPVDPQFSQKTRINYLSYLNISFCRFVTIHAFNGQTDGQNSHRKTASAFHATQ